MISISEKIYQDLAAKLIGELKNSNFYNGTIEMDYPELYTTLHCTLLVYHTKEELHPGHTTRTIDQILPVWWEFETASPYGFEHNDFSWCEFYRYLEAYI